MRITPPLDDYGRRLRRIENAQSGTVRQPQRTEPYPGVAPSDERRERPEWFVIWRRLWGRRARPPLTEAEDRRRQAVAEGEEDEEESLHRVDVRV